MQKEFNDTGTCIASRHYMMDVNYKLEQVMNMVNKGKYFTINRPRQYGKTTMLFLLEENLTTNENFLVLKVSFEDIGDSSYQNEEIFSQTFLGKLEQELSFQNNSLVSFISENKIRTHNYQDLSIFITQLIQKSKKQVVLLIDEVDAGTNYPIFLKFLATLRNKFLNRYRRGQETFHSVILAGVHDIKTLKQKMRPDDQRKYNSPWNIATDFKVQMSFIPSEIAPMLEEFSKAEKVIMDTSLIAEKLYYYTSGYPFLVSKLCKIIAEDILSHKATKTWTLEDLEDGLNLLLKENNTNFDSLIKNLENNQSLYDLVYQVIIEGNIIPFNQHNPTIHIGVLYGVFKDNGQVKVHNRIYEQLIYNYMISKELTKINSANIYGGHFVLEDKSLDLEMVLLKFQQYMKEQFSEKSVNFLEQHGRLIFLSFLAPILNGHGHSFKEVQTSMEKRLDIIITFFQYHYIIELKRWYGEKAHQKGLDQLTDYLDIHSVKEGYLVIFDDRKKKEWKHQKIVHKGKNIFAIWV